jgi:small subunit ribosomal protein S4
MKPLKEKKERALGVKLFIKADRCNSPKCVMIRRPYRPGMHGQKHRALSDYGRSLQEKQKLQIVYGLNNNQMANLFKKYDKWEIIQKLEMRLDRVVYLLGLSRSQRIARQLVSHGHVLVNGRKVTIPSYTVKVGDVISIRPQSRKLSIFEDVPLRLKQYTPPSWLKVNPEDLSGICLEKPSFEEKSFPFDLNLVVQFYSR